MLEKCDWRDTDKLLCCKLFQHTQRKEKKKELLYSLYYFEHLFSCSINSSLLSCWVSLCTQLSCWNNTDGPYEAFWKNSNRTTREKHVCSIQQKISNNLTVLWQNPPETGCLACHCMSQVSNYHVALGLYPPSLLVLHHLLLRRSSLRVSH